VVDDDGVRYESVEGIATITINRTSKKNAINREISEALEAAWRTFDDGDDRVAVITGAGGDFTAGIDVNSPPLNPYWAPNLGLSTDKPVIAAIDGWCIGAGMMLLQQVDLAISSRSAKFRYPEAKLGLSRGLAAGIAAKVPYKIAMEILLLGRVHGPESFLQAGFINRIVDDGDALTVAHEWAVEIAAADLDVVRYIKRGILDLVPRGVGERSAHTQWVADQLPGNIQLKSGNISVEQLRSV
jgi:enoyl-CoA hydratase